MTFEFACCMLAGVPIEIIHGGDPDKITFQTKEKCAVIVDGLDVIVRSETQTTRISLREAAVKMLEANL